MRCDKLNLPGVYAMWLFRILIEPDAENGLDKPSQVMVDKTQSVPRTKVGEPFGRLSKENMQAVTRALAVFFGFAGAYLSSPPIHKYLMIR